MLLYSTDFLRKLTKNMNSAVTIKDLIRHREREATPRQVRAVGAYIVANGRKSKAEVLREVGYSEAVATHPDRVFGNPAVRELLLGQGVDEKPAIQAVKRSLNARRVEHIAFPPFRVKADGTDENESDEGDDGQGYTTGEKRGEQLSDKEIIELLASVNCVVRRIVHGDMARHVYFWSDKDKAQLEAADMVFNLLGSYAPKKVEGKHEHKVGVFSMSDLRKKMKENGFEIIPKQ